MLNGCCPLIWWMMKGILQGKKPLSAGLMFRITETLSALAGGGECGVFVVANTSHLEESSALVRYLLENS